MLKLLNITKSFQGSFEPVFSNLDLHIKDGDFCCIIGSNGSGKSTLLGCISGEYNVDNGAVLINGTDLTNKIRTQFISSVSQDVNKGTVSEMTLLENIVLSIIRTKGAKLKLFSNYEKKAISQIQELNIGLENYIKSPMSSLSGGQRQIMATLMSIQSEPQILLLDEHTSALDPKMQDLLMRYTVEAILKRKITSLMITHKLDDAIKYGNRLIMLHKGKIILDVEGADKSALSIDELLKLFHKHEDLNLISRNHSNSQHFLETSINGGKF